jgi:hypothetical protein
VVVAHEYGFESWADLAEFTDAIRRDRSVECFETAVDAVISGDVAVLLSLLKQNPELVRARSTRRHHATLLHYVAANGVEGGRQMTPSNAVEIAKTLLDAGAEVDALADMYEAKCTTMSMLVSSETPAEAGLQAALAETLIDYGAALNGPGSKWQSAVLTALAFGYLSTAEALARHGAPRDHIAAVAGLGSRTRLGCSRPPTARANTWRSRSRPSMATQSSCGCSSMRVIQTVTIPTAAIRIRRRCIRPCGLATQT